MLRAREGIRYVRREGEILRLEGEELGGTVQAWDGKAWVPTRWSPATITLDGDSWYVELGELARLGIPES